jgi:hypothetical protein
MTVLAWVRAAVSLASRASFALRLLGQLRSLGGGRGGERVRGRARRMRATGH